MTNAKNKFRLLLTGLLMCFSLVQAAPSKIVNFPGKLDVLASPHHKYLVFNVNSDTVDDKGNNHSLWIEEIATKKKEKILSYGRHVEVFWSPTGDFLVVNNYEGSDFSNCMMLSTKDGYGTTNIADEFQTQVRDDLSLKNHHVYIQGTKWMNNMALEIKVHGYGDGNPNGFERRYSYNIKEKSFVHIP